MKFHWEEIERIAKAHHLESPTDSSESFLRFLMFWWCEKYNRPLKDPMLKEYTIDELWYEFLRHFYRIPENDPTKKLEETEKEKDDLEWVQSQLDKLKGQVPSSAPIEPRAALELPEIQTKFDE